MDHHMNLPSRFSPAAPWFCSLASWLPGCLMHVASFSLPLSALVFPFSHYLFTVMTLRLLVRLFAILVNIASQLSTLPFHAFLACFMLPCHFL
jgi:hypothetical protein